MKRTIQGVALAVAATMAVPAAAQDNGEDNGRSLMERGAEMFLDGLMQEMEPTLEDLRGMAEKAGPAFRDFMREMGPALAEILGDIEDLSNYHPPEMLPNGDIIIRRKTPLDPAPEPDEEIEI
ncbi:hypothetical protein [Roseovarius salis]|uniref:hypothetical protein n=1 Tax=Roseovarius salis TaxID=3376063 RepID=UPI0037CC8F4D